MWLQRPEGYTNLDCLCLCAGYEGTMSHDLPRVVVHQEHRMVLPAIWAAIKDEVFADPPFLLRLDAHDDWPHGEADERDYANDFPRIQTIEDCILFANALPDDDGGWVEAAVSMGWVREVLTVGIHEVHQPIQRVRNIDDQERSVACLPWDLSCDVEPAVRDAVGRVIECVGPLDRPVGGRGPLWLDIDLDFAIAILPDDRLRVRGDCELGRWLDTPLETIGGPKGFNLGDLVERAIKRASLVTIATEPTFCGGHAAVAQAIEVLERCIGNSGEVLQFARMDE